MLTNIFSVVDGEIVQADELLSMSRKTPDIPAPGPSPEPGPEPGPAPVEHSVVIGGKKYRTVTMPDGREWLAENLALMLDNFTSGEALGSATVPMADWYAFSREEYENFGLFYNWPAVMYMDEHRDELFPGWRVPSIDELETLVASVDTWTQLGVVGWEDCTDDYEFSMIPAGLGNQSYGVQRFMSKGGTAVLTSRTAPDPEHTPTNDIMWFKESGSRSNYPMAFQFSLRLVKDA
jgi:uncharacterized protein (TIGR02145 family)